jgi:hypothetical protein
MTNMVIGVINLVVGVLVYEDSTFWGVANFVAATINFGLAFFDGVIMRGIK